MDSFNAQGWWSYENELVEASGTCCRKYTTSLGSHHKNVMDKIREDFSRTMSHVYIKSPFVSHGLVNKPMDLQASFPGLG